MGSLSHKAGNSNPAMCSLLNKVADTKIALECKTVVFQNNPKPILLGFAILDYRTSLDIPRGIVSIAWYSVAEEQHQSVLVM